MADMGFLPEVKRLLDQVPDDRQTLLFSATLDGAVDELIRRYQHAPGPPRAGRRPRRRRQGRAPLLDGGPRRAHRAVRQGDLLDSGPTIVFCRTKRGADRVARQLEAAGVRAAAIHGDRSQGQRERALAVVPARPGRRAGRHRRGRPRHPRRRRGRGRAPRSAGRREGLHPPLGPHRPGRGQRRGGVVRGARAAPRRGQDAADARDAHRHDHARRHRPSPGREPVRFAAAGRRPSDRRDADAETSRPRRSRPDAGRRSQPWRRPARPDAGPSHGSRPARPRLGPEVGAPRARARSRVPRPASTSAKLNRKARRAHLQPGGLDRRRASKAAPPPVDRRRQGTLTRQPSGARTALTRRCHRLRADGEPIEQGQSQQEEGPQAGPAPAQGGHAGRRGLPARRSRDDVVDFGLTPRKRGPHQRRAGRRHPRAC